MQGYKGKGLNQPYVLHNTIWGSRPVAIGGIVTDPTNNDRSTSDTICLMRSNAVQASHSPIISSAVDTALEDLSPKSFHRDRAVVQAIYWFVKRNVRFVFDESIMMQALGIPQDDLDKELLISPEVLLSMPQPMGDCDDFSTLLASMLLNLNFQVWFVTVAADESKPMEFTHVYVATYLNDEGVKIPLDASHGKYLGWETDRQWRREEWLVS